MGNLNFNNEIDSLVQEGEASGVLVPGTGVAVGVIKDSEILFQGGFGFLDGNLQNRVTERTVFSISSSTKAFTALAFLKLFERGQVDLHKPINGTHSILQLRDPEITRQITIADVLCHRVGLPANDLLWALSSFSIEELGRRLRYLELVPHGFRKGFFYNNLMYSALAGVFREISGRHLTEFVETEILRPLKMNSTEFSPGMAPIAPAGGLISNVSDVIKWQMYLMGGEKTHQVMFESHNAIQPPPPVLFIGLDWLMEQASYGWGWMVSSWNGKKVIFHPGFVEGHSTLLMQIPETGYAISVLTKASFSPFPGILARNLLERIFGLPRPPQPTSKSQTPIVEVAEEPGPLKLEIVGRFEHPAYGEMELIENSNGYAVKYFDHEWVLKLISPTEARFAVEVFGLQFPMIATLGWQQGVLKRLEIPLAMDPCVRPIEFIRI